MSRSRSGSRIDDPICRAAVEEQRAEEQQWEQHQVAAAEYLLGQDLRPHDDGDGQLAEPLKAPCDASQRRTSGTTSWSERRDYEEEIVCGEENDSNARGVEEDESEGEKDAPNYEKWEKEYLSQVEKEHQESLRREKDEEERMTREELSQSGESCELNDTFLRDELYAETSKEDDLLQPEDHIYESISVQVSSVSMSCCA